MLLLLQSDICPYCGKRDSGCAIEVEDITGIKAKDKEMDFIDEFLGRSGPRATFVFTKNVCNEEKK